MFHKKRQLSRKRLLIIIISLVAVFILLVRPAIIFHRHQQKPDQSSIASQDQKLTIDAAPESFIFSVAVDNRYYHLARKVGIDRYEILYVNPYHNMKHCQTVYTTGFDKQFPPDVKIGYIDNITRNIDDLYSTITISNDLTC